jgi:hypothetical protein
MGRRSSTQVSRARRLARAAARICATLVLIVVGYVALVQVGVLPNPLAPVAKGDVALARSGKPGLRVLFVGNSFTFAHSMPELIHRLAEADPRGKPIFTVEYTAPFWSLRAASEDHGLTRLLHGIHWDVVVLQERSWIPSLAADERAKQMDQYAWSINADIATVKAQTMLFMTWGYKHGYGRVPGDTFASMQARLAAGYDDLARRLAASVAPVGLAWASALRGRPDLALWEGDGQHPSKSGSFLAACVFYAELSGGDPRESGFTDGLDQTEARYLKRVAAETVARPARSGER